VGVPDPVVTGPIAEPVPAGDPSRNYIFFSRPEIEGRGYIEQEFFYEGTALRVKPRRCRAPTSRTAHAWWCGARDACATSTAP
jgi:hypothetical protein